MPSISLATYIVRLTHRHQAESLPLDEFREVDLFTLFREYLDSIKGVRQTSGAKSLLRASDVKEDERKISGKVWTGDYGHTSELVDAETGSVNYERQTTDAEMMPFFFLAHFPEDEPRGILMLQRFGNFGAYTSFARSLKDQVSSRNSEVTLHLEETVHPELIRQFGADGLPTRIRLRKHKLPQDICDRFENKVRPDQAYLEVSIIARKKGGLLNLRELFDGLSDGKILSIPDFGNIEPDQKLIEISLNGKKRTIDVQNPKKIRSYFDITDDVKLGPDGHPVHEEVEQIAVEILGDLWAALKGVAK